ncbi:MAG TPA: GNAT family N-acetyltransferase [Pseudobacteroides sp.]|uniref:GNAT family N-acetyltransferase n=1 Tax=Pseudobacteroides sp. TaxID=1968840 RepID=UPI002F9277BE
MSKLEKIFIRDAQINDLKAIIEIYNSTVPGRIVTADTEPVSIASRKRWFYEHSSDFRPLWVAIKDEEIVGWLSFQSFYGRPAYNKTAELSIYIAEGFRKKGIGQLLLKKALDESPRLKINNLLGFIFGHNIASLNLFYKFGFVSWGVFPGVAEIDGVERDLVIVGKRVVNLI